jgi:hypothetical protein
MGKRKEFSMRSWLKAGLIGGAILFVLNLLGFIPCVGLITCFLGLFIYVGIGALAAHYMPPIRETGAAAGEGALAAVVAALIGGIVNAVVTVAQAALVGPGQVMTQLPPETLRQLEQAGMDPQMFEQIAEMSAGVGGAALCGSACCLIGLLIAAALGAAGGAIYAAMQSD